MNLAVIIFEPYWLAFTILVVIWSLEHFVIQSSLFESPPITRYPLFYRLCRLKINVLACIFILSIFSIPWIWGIIGLDLLLSMVVIAYQKYFQKPFVPFGALGNLREGVKAFSFAIRIIPLKLWILLMTGFFAKCFLVSIVSQSSFATDWHLRHWTAILTFTLISVIVLLLQKTSFRFSSIGHTSITRPIYAYGYLISWIADLFLSPSAKEIADELVTLQKDSPDRLAENDIPYEINQHVVVLQLESLDWNILNFQINGKSVTPFLNELAASSQVFKIEAFHDQGTADMDYAVLSGGMPSKRILSYAIPDLDYPNALPRFMRGHGFHTVSLHGATGSFFNRRANFERMHWDEIHFREEFKTQHAEESYWGARDHEVLKYSSDKLNAASGPEFHFLITLDSHGPYNLIKDEEKTIFPGSRNWKQNYFNSMAALDQNLNEYISSLPPETLVVLYGDHTSGVDYGKFSPARDGATEYVPCIVHQRPAPGETPTPLTPLSSLPKDLSIHDIINCLRRKIKQG